MFDLQSNLAEFLSLFEFHNLSFSRFWGLLFIPLPLFIYFASLIWHSLQFTHSIPRNQAKAEAIHIPKLAQLGILARYQLKKLSKKNNFFSWLLVSLIWILMCIALANPQKISEPISLSKQARDLMIAIDLSHSMASNDFNFQNQTVDRLSATKWVVESFIEQRKGDRIGLILFADRAFTQSPLTFDLKSIQTYLEESQVGLVGEKTAIGDAIALAARRYSGIDTNNQLNLNPIGDNENKAEKILILLTDGANNTGNFTPLEAANLAKEVGLKIYSISIGPDFINQGIGFFSRRIPRSEYADEQTLKQVAQITGGQHFFAGNANELMKVYEVINNLEPVEQETQVFRYQTSLFHYPLALSLLLLILLFIRENTGQNRIWN